MGNHPVLVNHDCLLTKPGCRCLQDAGCLCQQHGKSGVPWASGKCMVCGHQTNPRLPVSRRTREAPRGPLTWVVLRDEQDEPSRVLAVSGDLILAQMVCQADSGPSHPLKWRMRDEGVREAVGHGHTSYRVEPHGLREDR